MKLVYEDFEKILKMGIELSTERKADELLSSILDNGMNITNCDASTLYLFKDNKLYFKIMKTLSMGVCRGENGETIEDIPPVPLSLQNVCAYSAIKREVVNVENVYESTLFDFSGPRKYDQMTGYHSQSMLVIPIENNKNELLGVLQLINAMDEVGKVISFHKEYEIIIQSLSCQAAIEITNLQYTEEVKELLASFVEAMATAIDARTPYNGSHTRKVAEYATLLADLVNEKHEAGECEEFFSPEHMEEIRLAALLHDIGKMIIPLSVMNRATRLDKDMERVESRFELLKAYYKIDGLRGILTQEEAAKETDYLNSAMDFIKAIDAKGFLDDQSYERISEIAGRKYSLQDGNEIPYLTEKEAKCLQIRKGTLTDEDRKTMENHVEMTSKILSKVHFNKNYKDVPKWAAQHHEYLDGSGYPDQITGDRLGIETRMLTVADIYDALTATDRPYKEPMPRERALAILHSMAEEGKLDERLVNWFEEAVTREGIKA